MHGNFLSIEMARLNTFKIQFHSYEIGVHEMVFDVNDSFFAFFDDSEISQGQVKITVKMTKGARATITL